MKTYAILLLFLSLGFSSTKVLAQSEDDAIKTCINNYLEGITKGDTARLNKAFHPNALLKTVNATSGKIQDFAVKNFIARTPAGGLQATPSILNYSYAGVSASSAVELSSPDFKYIDLLSLLKINGEWKIVARVFSRVEPGVELISPMGGSKTTTKSSGGSTSKPAAPKPKKPKSDDDWK
jgi:hypothetical protein